MIFLKKFTEPAAELGPSYLPSAAVVVLFHTLLPTLKLG